ncbi:MAG: hypothetical protein HY532_05095 [Chloroflexi bacterium]|nr:hypothetical protein [Chloroflexota bacterium]
MTQTQTPLPPTRRMPATNDFPTGPAVDELLPDFTLTDQTGTPVNFTHARQGKRAMVVFSRSVRW